MTSTKVSATMARAIDIARAHGAELKRLPGGFWVGATIADVSDMHAKQAPWVTWHTIQALIDRGFLAVSDKAGRAPYQFAVRVRLTDRA